VADLGVAAILAGAALEAALLLARVNVRDVGDPIFVSRVHEALQRLAAETVALRHQLTRTVAARTGVSA
jgi:formiminotetrahydrofolate cyclodeaminase